MAFTPVDIGVDNGGEAGAVPVDALGDTATPKGSLPARSHGPERALESQLNRRAALRK